MKNYILLSLAIITYIQNITLYSALKKVYILPLSIEKDVTTSNLLQKMTCIVTEEKNTQENHLCIRQEYCSSSFQKFLKKSIKTLPFYLAIPAAVFFFIFDNMTQKLKAYKAPKIHIALPRSAIRKITRRQGRYKDPTGKPFPL